MNRVHPYVPWPALWVRTTPFTKLRGRRFSLLNGQGVITVERALPQAIQVSNGDLAEPLELILPKQGELSLEDGHGSLT